MSIPGFTAEISAARSVTHYQITALPQSLSTVAITGLRLAGICPYTNVNVCLINAFQVASTSTTPVSCTCPQCTDGTYELNCVPI
jgi:hypothetical protein